MTFNVILSAHVGENRMLNTAKRNPVRSQDKIADVSKYHFLIFT